jgi:hypothetical protein
MNYLGISFDNMYLHTYYQNFDNNTFPLEKRAQESFF